MANLLATQVDDLVAETLDDLDQGQPLIQIAQNQHDYPVFNRMINKNSMMFSGGMGITRSFFSELGASAVRSSGLFATQTANAQNHLKKMSIDWTYLDTSWTYDILEALHNSGEYMIHNVIKPRRAKQIIDLAEHIENAFWSVPEPSEANKPFGIPYWIVKNSAAGFNGGYPISSATSTAYTDIANVNLTDVPNFKNWTDSYASFTREDARKKLRNALRRTKWKTPKGVSNQKTFGEDRVLYCNEETLNQALDLAEKQNDNLGKDLDSMNGVPYIQGHQFEWSEQLDDDTTNPIYGVNHTTLRPVGLRGNWFRQDGPVTPHNQRNVRIYYTFLSYNIICEDRRRNFVIYKPA